MAYKTPKVVAKSTKKASYVAGCPVERDATSHNCHKCERTQ